MFSFYKENLKDSSKEDMMERQLGAQTGSLILRSRTRQEGIEQEEAFLWRNGPRTIRGTELAPPCFLEVTGIPVSHHHSACELCLCLVAVTFQDSASSKVSAHKPLCTQNESFLF